MWQFAFAEPSNARTFIRLSKETESGLLRLREEIEQYGDLVPEINDRRWKSTLSLELDPQSDKSHRRLLWQMSVPGRFDSEPQIRPRDFIVSDVAKRQVILVFARHNDICVVHVSLDATQTPFGAKAESGKADVVHDLGITDFTTHTQLRKAHLEESLGIKFSHFHRISLKSAAKIDSGWRIDATVDDIEDRRETKLPDGTVYIDMRPKPVLRFVVNLDEECKSAKVDVAK